MFGFRFLLLPLALAVCVPIVSGCASVGLQTDPSYQNKDRDALYKNGSLVSESGGFALFGAETQRNASGNGIGVNGFLWRATLDTVSFLPIISADPFGGVILTDWHSTQAAPDERAKLNIVILGRELRADGVKVTVFRQVKEAGGEWADASSSTTTASAIENAILSKARQLRASSVQ